MLILRTNLLIKIAEASLFNLMLTKLKQSISNQTIGKLVLKDMAEQLVIKRNTPLK